MPVPDSVPITGGALDAQGLLVWGPHRVWRFNLPSDSTTGVQIRSADATVIAAELDRGAVLVLRLTAPNALRLSRLWPDTAEIAEWRVPVRPELARQCGGVWYIGGRNRIGFYHVYRLSTRTVIQEWAASYASGSLSPYSLSCIAGHIAVTDIPPPFHTMTVGKGLDVSAFAPLADSTDFGTAVFPAWVSSPVFPLGRRWLQVFAELRGDRRLFVLYDSTGHEFHRRTLNTPVGVLAVSERGPYMLVTRRLKGTAVIVYRWRWADPSLLIPGT